MRITIFGAGAIGGHIAARLGARTDHDLSVVARGAHLRAIQKTGIRLRWSDGREEVGYPRATDNPGSLSVQDVVIVTLKQPTLASAIDDILKLVDKDTAVAFVLNGIPWWYEPKLERLDPGGRIYKSFSLTNCVGAVAFSANEVLSPGLVDTHSATGDRYFLGPVTAADDTFARRTAAPLRDAGIDCPIMRDIRPIIWRKLMLNVAFAGPATLIAGTIGDVQRDATLRRFSEALMIEIGSIAVAKGLQPIPTVTEAEEAMIARSSHRPSLLQDLMLGRAMELTALFGIVLEFARDCHVDVPCLDLLTTLLMKRANNANHSNS